MLCQNPGIYHAKVTGIGIGESTNGLARASIGFDIYETSDGEPIEDQKITGFFPLQKTTGEIIVHVLDSLKAVFPTWDGRDIFWLQDNEAELVGTPAQIVVESSEYNGKVSLQVKYLNVLGSEPYSGVKRSSGDVRKKISMSLNIALRATAKPGLAKSAPKAAAKPAMAAKPTAKPKAPVTPGNAAATAVDADSVWAEFAKAWPEGVDGIEDAWHNLLAITGKKESFITGSDWLQIRTHIPQFLPMDEFKTQAFQSFKAVNPGQSPEWYDHEFSQALSAWTEHKGHAPVESEWMELAAKIPDEIPI